MFLCYEFSAVAKAEALAAAKEHPHEEFSGTPHPPAVPLQFSEYNNYHKKRLCEYKLTRKLSNLHFLYYGNKSIKDFFGLNKVLYLLFASIL